MEKCGKTGCQAIMYKSGLCRNHLLDKIGVDLRRVLRLLYKDPESAFCVFNSTGQTTITIDEMLANKLVLSRVGHSPDDVVNFLLRDRVFLARDGQLGFHEFKKVFFPYATLMNMEVEDAVKRQES
jgi:hypothetical protein